MNDDFEPIDRAAIIEGVELVIKLVEQQSTDHALRLLDALRWRLQIDEAMEFRSEIATLYGPSVAMQ